MEYSETAAYAHTRLRESIEDSLLELSGRLEQRSQIEENATWAQVADLRRLNNLLEQALEFFKGNDWKGGTHHAQDHIRPQALHTG